MRILNPKHEYRNTKQIPNTKKKNSKRIFEKLGFRILKLFIFLFLMMTSLTYASSATDALSRFPVQHAGRIKPFESFAREAAFFVTGKFTFEKKNATELLWRWMAEPELWFTKAMIPIGHPEMMKEFGVGAIQHRISPEMALQHAPFIEKVREASEKKQAKKDLTLVEKRRLEIYERARLFQEIAEGRVPGWMAHPEDPLIAWLPFSGLLSPEMKEVASAVFPAEKIQEASTALSELLSTIQSQQNLDGLEEKAANFESALGRLRESRNIWLDESNLNREILYNRFRPFHWSWVFYLAAVFLGVGAGSLRPVPGVVTTPLRMSAACFFLIAFAIHTYGFYLRSMIAGRPPVTNMYESVVWVSWAAVLFSIVLFIFQRAILIPLAAALVSSLALLLAERLPAVLDPTISPLVPVLRNNFWLTIHVLTITLSYGAFALAWGLGHWALFRFATRAEDVELQKKLVQYLYRALQIGVILLASGTVLGGVWAHYSWGRFWGWDPKETWALIALLGYLVVLHGRFAGWLDWFGLTAGSVIAFLGVLMAWYGVNFVLAAGLHSYGFGGGGLEYVTAAVLADLVFVAWAAWAYRKNRLQVTRNH